MSKAKFDAAKELIQSKQYDEARALLRTIDHPTARAWEAKLDTIAPPGRAQASPRKRSRLPIIIAGIVIIILITVAILIPLMFKNIVAEDMASGVVCTEKHCYDATTGAILDATDTPDAETIRSRATVQAIICEIEATNVAAGEEQPSGYC